MADRLDYDAENCTIAKTLAIVGEKWTLLIIRDLFYGLRRFDDLHRSVGCARTVLSDRLATLVAHDLVARAEYRAPGQRSRLEYRLTEKGVDLFPALQALREWGDRWEADPQGPPVIVRHRDCGAALRGEVRCADGHGPLAARDAQAGPGPAAKRRPVAASSAG